MMTGTIFSRFDQIGIVVKDLNKAVKKFESLGIGPFKEFKADYFKRTLWGKPIIPLDSVKILISKAWMGPMEIELMQPVAGDSHWKRFLDSRGDDIQHLSFFCDDVEKEQAEIAKKGFNIIYTSRHATGGAVYFETGIDGIIFEPSQRKLQPGSIGPEPFGWKAHHVGVVVKDLDKAITTLKSLGVTPFQLHSHVFTERTLWGKPIPIGSVKNKTASAQMGSMRLELIQPVEGDSPWKRFLDRTGGGMQHLGFTCDDIEREEAMIAKKGFTIIYSGRQEGGVGACYFEIGLGDMIFEVLRPRKK